MKLLFCRLQAPNFGDELSPWLWSRLLPGLFDDDESQLFLGIGSILSAQWNGPAIKHVMGTAFVPEYCPRPDIGQGDWRIYFVRGPRTCAGLGLDPQLGVGDPALLIRTLRPTATGGETVSFMPHWESAERGSWDLACEMAGVRLIDPRWPVERILDAIGGSRLLLTEAMHGAIVADALRVPVTPLLPHDSRHRAKWADWAESIGFDLDPAPLRPSSPTEHLARLTRRPDILGPATRLQNSAWLSPLRRLAAARAAKDIRRAAAREGRLSPDGRIETACDRMQAIIHDFGRTRGLAM